MHIALAIESDLSLPGLKWPAGPGKRSRKERVSSERIPSRRRIFQRERRDPVENALAETLVEVASAAREVLFRETDWLSNDDGDGPRFRKFAASGKRFVGAE